MRIIHYYPPAAIVGFVVMMTLGCDGSNGPTTGPPATGAIRITVSTEGADPDLDTDGYRITVDGRSGWDIGVRGAVTIDHLTQTSHFVILNGLASNCSVAASNERWVDVVAGGLAELAYSVKCDPMPTDCGWDCYYWSRSVPPSMYDTVSANGRVSKPARAQ